MEKGTSKDISRVFRMLDADDRNNISRFCSACSRRDYRVYTDPDVALIHCDNGSGYSSEVKDIFFNFTQNRNY